jgi:cob(I)alamin adenosyltransferase
LEDKKKKSRAPKENGNIKLITSTKKGDRGTTRLLSGEKVSKSSLRIEACGNLDESGAAMGLAKALTQNETIRNIIANIQKDLFVLGAELSSTVPRVDAKRIGKEHTVQLEKWITDLQREVPLAPRFVESGANSVSAALDLARSIVRRTERSVVLLLETEQLERAEILKYVNRLGCLLYTLARYAEKTQ